MFSSSKAENLSKAILFSASTTPSMSASTLSMTRAVFAIATSFTTSHAATRPAEVRHHGGDVLLQHRQQARARPVAVAQPARHRGVGAPGQRVAEHLLPVLLCERHNRVGDREVELPALRLQVRDLHRGLGSDRVVTGSQSRPVTKAAPRPAPKESARSENRALREALQQGFLTPLVPPGERRGDGIYYAYNGKTRFS
jgi:hypothetical protein